MIKRITMPAGGQTTDQALVAQWHVKKGDRVKRGDLLLDVETDKTVLAVESFAAGIVIDILVPQGETASAGKVLALIGNDEDLKNYKKNLTKTVTISDTVQPMMTDTAQTMGADTIQMATNDEYRPIMQKNTSAEVAPLGSTIQTSDIKVMPNAKKYARENGIDLIAFAKDTGMRTIKQADLKAAPAAMRHTGTETTPHTAYIDVPHSSMRRTIARRMLESTQNIPSYQVMMEVDMTACIEFRTAINARQNHVKVGYNDIIMKSIGMAVRNYPNINAAWTATAVRQYSNVNIGLAVSLNSGLIVPVIAGVERLGILQIARETSDKIAKARAGKLSSSETTGGTITLSNMGMYPVQHFTAIINPPEVCILALGSVQEKHIVHDGNTKIAPIMTITASFDHRVIDGAYGAQFLNELKQLLEVPALLFC